MKARILVTSCLFGVSLSIGGCSSGLSNNLSTTPPNNTVDQASTNMPLGFDVGLQPTSPVVEPAAAGIVIPAIGSKPERDVVLLAFSTAADADDGDGLGTVLSRDAVTDTNSASDVFVAAICAQDIDMRAFSQSLAGKFRHPRCTTCHSMQAADTNAFVSSAISTQSGGAQPHAGPPPGPTFPNNDPGSCADCHANATLFPVNDWQAPAASFDLRPKSVAELAVAAQNVPVGDTEHFVTDARVLWALDSGVLPTVGGGNGIADDDHDGIDEPSDRDGIIRIVPGGSATFIQQIEDWDASGNIVTAVDAVRDITLVSRSTVPATAGNGASSRPQVVWEPNGSFAAPGTVGTLWVVYQSDADDLVAGDGNNASDIFRTAINLNADAAGNLDLVVNGNATLVSATDGNMDEGNGSSTMARAGGATANMVVFQSLATDLVTGFVDANGGASADIYVRDLDANVTHLISHQESNGATGGNGASTVPSIDATGVGVAFASLATNLIAVDTNGVQDVFYADISGNAPFAKSRASVTSTGAEGTGGISADPSIYVGGGRTLVAFESDKVNLAPSLTATTNVYVFDSSTALSTLLNQRSSTSIAMIGDGSARNPVISQNGFTVAFESDAGNIDMLRDDENGVTDIFLANVAQALAGNVLPYRFSLTTVEAVDGDGASTEPRFSSFSSASSSFDVGVAVYSTAATNLGTSDSTNLIVAFLDETTGVLADFSATLASGPAPWAITFTDASSGATATAWQWDFDNDGSVDSTEQNPTHTFTVPGYYSVRLVASNDNSSNEITKVDFARAIGIPQAEFSATPTSGTASLSVGFTDTSTEEPTEWSWDFDNDGNVDSILQNPSHNYANPGLYTVALTATNEAGTTTETKTDFIEVFTPVVAGFTTSSTSGTVTLPVAFLNTSTGATSYSWDFGDGSPTVTTPSTLHFYTVAGTYTATLTATGPGGTDTASTVITANGVVTADFQITISSTVVTSGYEASTITLNASSSTNATSYAWDLNNNGVNTQSGVNVTGSVGTLFPTSSQTTYTIKLTATGPGGSAQTTKTFTSVADEETTGPLTATQDTTIYSNNTNFGNGADNRLVIGKTFIFGYRRALLQFNVSSIPPNSTIQSAKISMRDASPAGSGGYSAPGTQLTGTQAFNIHRVTTSWSEGSGNSSSGIGTATGASATFGNTGSNFAGSATGSITINNPAAGPTYSTFLSTNLATDVENWVASPPVQSNFGWMLKSSTETGASSLATIKWLQSSEGTTAPVLNVTYTRPLP